MNDMEEYYKKRAKEYEQIYYRNEPVRQKEQNVLANAIKTALNGRNVLEIACGTGYWTMFLSETAKSIIATDIVSEVLDIAKRKHYPNHVYFQKEDAYNLSFEDKSFDGGMAILWFSHIPKDKIDSFLNEFHRVLQKGSRIFIADNVYLPDVGGTLITKHGDKDTYKIRRLGDGNENTVLKNYYSPKELVDIFSKHVNFGKENIFYGSCFWYVHYEL